jgi:hypothetical protein
VTNNDEISIVRWFDRRAVTLVTSFSSVNPLVNVKRYDLSSKGFVDVVQPLAVSTYNQYMGGVDAHDQYVAYLHHHIRSVRWYIHIFHNLVRNIIVNCWVLFKECDSSNKQMMLRTFSATLSNEIVRKHDALVKITKHKSDMRGSVNLSKKRKLNDSSALEHMPIFLEKRKRCVICHDKNSLVSCETCQVCLCFNQQRNCFRDFHRKN